MRALAIAAIITSLAVPAFAAEDPSKAEQYKFEEQKKKEAEEIEGAVAGVVGIEVGVVSGVFNLESSGVDAPDWRPRHEEH